MRTGSWLILATVTAAAFGAVLLAPPVAQDPAYHAFADRRPAFGIPNAADVLSNVPFVAVGLWGLLFAARAGRAGAPFATPAERLPYAAFFVGVALTGFGSAYYHLAPDNDRLFWDRLPMSVAFVSLVAATAGERLSRRAGRALFPLLLAAGVGSVVYWDWTEGRGAGDLRPYILVQFYSVAALLLLAVAFRSSYTRGPWLLAVVGCYAGAKVLELLDAEVYAAGAIASGHTLKHLLSAVGAWLVVHMLRGRTLAGGAGRGVAPPRPRSPEQASHGAWAWSRQR